MSKKFIFLTLLVLAVVSASAHADKLTGLADVTVVDGAIVSLRHEGVEYVVADGDLSLGTTTRWYIPASGLETLWVDGTPAPAATDAGTSTVKAGDIGPNADNFFFAVPGDADNISSIDGIDFQQTIFPFLTRTIFHFERGGNDSGTWQAILADGSLGTPVAFSGATAYADTGVNNNGQNAFGVVFTTDVPVQGVRITASGHDTLSISAPTPLLVLADIPNPPDGATDVPRDVVLSWTPGIFAPPVNGHRVYLSDIFTDVNDGIGGITQDANSYAPAQRLEFGTTYYWRVDEVNAPPDSTVYQGGVWSFTTEPVGYPIDGANITATASSSAPGDFGPEKTIDGSGLNANDGHSTDPLAMWLSDTSGPQPTWIEYQFDKVYKLHEMWVWNSNQSFESFLGYGPRDVTVEYSTDGVEWTTLADAPEFAQAPAPAIEDYAHNTTVDFGGVAAKYVKLTVNSNWASVLPQSCLSEVRFLQIPAIARTPSPDSGATDVSVDVTLGWRAGRGAVTHNVSFSADEQAVIDGTAPVAAVAGASYSPALDLGNTYYWRIDEVNDAETPTTWQGDVWSFSTQEFIVVEDFESYNDIDPPGADSNRIFEGWPDGFGVATNGALVGYDPPQPSYAETTIVRGGKQSMPMFYSNTAGATYSEAERTFAASQDWTKYGVTTLRLWFRGAEGNTGQLYVKINGVKVPYDGDAANLAVAMWQSWNIDLTAIGVNLGNVTKLAIGIDGNGAAGTLYVDDIRLRSPSLAPQSAGLVHHWPLDEGGTDLVGGLDGTVQGPAVVPGMAGNGLRFDGQNDSVEFTGFVPPLQGTFVFWINAASVGPRGRFMGSADQFEAYVENGLLANQLFSAGSLPDYTESSTVLVENTWYHVALTYDGVSRLQQIYINGQLDAEGMTADDLWDGGNFAFGHRAGQNQQFYSGVLDDIRFYNGVLPMEEVQKLMN